MLTPSFCTFFHVTNPMNFSPVLVSKSSNYKQIYFYDITTIYIYIYVYVVLYTESTEFEEITKLITNENMCLPHKVYMKCVKLM